VDPRSTQVLHAHRLPDGGFHHGRPAQEGVGHPVDHDGLAGQVDDVGPPGRVSPRAERVLLEPLRRHPAHVVEEVAELVPSRENPVLQRQVGSRRIGDVDEVQAAPLGDLLGPQVLLAADGVIGPGAHAAVVGEDHDPVAVDLADPRHEPGGGDVVHALVADPEPGASAQLEKLRARVDQLPDEPARGFLALQGQPVVLDLASRVVRPFPQIADLPLFGQPVFPVLPVFLFFFLAAGRSLPGRLRHSSISFQSFRACDQSMP